VCVCVCVWACGRVCVVCVRVCAYVYVYACIPVYTYIGMPFRICLLRCVWNTYIHTHIRRYVNMYTNIHTHTLVCIYLVHFLFQLALPLGKLSFIGHSMGGIISRAALAHPLMRKHRAHLHTYCSLGSPHLGYIYTGDVCDVCV